MKNKLGIENQKLLIEVEHKIAMRHMLNLRRNKIPVVMSTKRLFEIHKLIFGDIYEWAGQIRRVELSKGDTNFLPSSAIPNALYATDKKIEAIQLNLKMGKALFVKALASLMLDINHIHPFREGNGRALREFIREIAENHGYHFLIDAMAKMYMEASINDDQHLTEVVLEKELKES